MLFKQCMQHLALAPIAASVVKEDASPGLSAGSTGSSSSSSNNSSSSEHEQAVVGEALLAAIKARDDYIKSAIEFFQQGRYPVV